MNNDFKDLMSQKTDEELIFIVSKDKEKYLPSALEAAEKEIEKREIDFKIINRLKEEVRIETSIKQDIKTKATSLQNRMINQVIDFLAIIILTRVLNALTSLLYNNTEDIDFIFFIISYFGYYIFMENKYQQTLGKLFTKTKVVKLNGDKPKLINIVGRTFLRTIPYDIISFFIDKNIFHDSISKTTVINLSSE